MNNIIRELELINWDFKRYRQTGIDNIHWYPANFIPQIPSILIANLSKPGAVVLDPFVGSGTTLVEAARLGRVGIGNDVNPLSFLITKAKTAYINPIDLEMAFKTIKELLEENTHEVLIPDFPNKCSWYHEDTLYQLGHIYSVINNHYNRKIRYLLQVCFSAILKKCCTQRDHYTYVADNMYPKKQSELIYVNAKKEFILHLGKTISAIISFYSDIKNQGMKPKGLLSQFQVLNEDSRTLKSIKDEIADIVVTSPPYANVTDYTTGHRLSFYWLEIGDLKNQKMNEIGARWKRARSAALDDYIKDLYISSSHIWRALKKGGYFCLVFGETSSVRKKYELNSKILSLLKNKLGFELLSKKIERSISAKRIRAVRGVSREHIYIFRKK